LGERLLCKQEVSGSIPLTSTTFRVDVTADWEKLKSLRAMVQTSRATVFDKVKREYPTRFDARH